MLRNRILMLVACAALLLLPQTGAQAQMAGLIGALTQQLNVTPQQAEGGAGAMFGYAKSNLSPQDYSTVSDSLPGVEGLIAKAPDVSAKSASGTSGGSGGLMGMAGKVLGGSAGTSLSSGDQLTQSFDALGLGAGMIQQFAPIILDYAEQVGGPGIAQILQGSMTLLGQ